VQDIIFLIFVVVKMSDIPFLPPEILYHITTFDIDPKTYYNLLLSSFVFHPPEGKDPKEKYLDRHEKIERFSKTVHFTIKGRHEKHWLKTKYVFDVKDKPGLLYSIGLYVHDVKEGKWIEWDLVYKIRTETTYDNGSKTERVTFFITNKQHKKRRTEVKSLNPGDWYTEGDVYITKGKLRGGKKQGLWIERYNSGAMKKQGRYIDNKKTGFWQEWFDSKEEKKMCECNYKNDLLDGRMKTWHETGIIESKGNYFAGAKVGVWKYRNTDNTMRRIIDYDEVKEKMQLQHRHFVTTREELGY
jgi:antitoxin component YwqK of YwqJK toxin-antitoxin module